MAQFDFRVRSGCHEIREYPLETSQTFEQGEPVVVDLASGEIEECATDPVMVTGIAAGTSLNRVPAAGGDLDGGTALADNTLIGVYLPTDNTLFCCDAENFATDGAATEATPTAANAVGETAGFTTDGTDWRIDTGANNRHVVIEALYNVDGQNVKDPLANSTTAALITFSFI